MDKSFDLSNRLYKILAILVAGILLFLLATALINKASNPNDYPREITVSGEGKTFIKPDIAIVTLGITNEANKAADAVKENNTKMNEIIKAVKDLGVEEKDITTTNYNLSPKYNYTESKGSFIDGYTLSQQIQVKIRNFDKIAEVLQKATSLGANTIDQLQFTVDDLEKVKAEAMKEAVTKAKEKAQNIAKASGIDLGRLVNVYEDYYSQDYSAPSYKAEGMGGGGAETPAPDIQVGEQEIRVKMNLVYRIE